MKKNIHFVLLICKRVIVTIFLISILVACSSQRYGPKPKPPTNKGGCNCPHFMYGNFINNFDNQTDDTNG